MGTVNIFMKEKKKMYFSCQIDQKTILKKFCAGLICLRNQTEEEKKKLNLFDDDQLNRCFSLCFVGPQYNNL